MNRELELKFKIEDIDKFCKKLANKNIVLNDPVEQYDTIFLKKGTTFNDLFNGLPVIRIRYMNKKIITTIKKYVDGIKDRLEVECEISDSESFRKYLELLDMEQVVIVEKKRRIGKYENVKICVDEVKGLGDFVELEIVAETDSIHCIHRQLSRMASELDLDTNNIVNKPYDEMIFERSNNGKKNG